MRDELPGGDEVESNPSRVEIGGVVAQKLTLGISPKGHSAVATEERSGVLVDTNNSGAHLAYRSRLLRKVAARG